MNFKYANTVNLPNQDLRHKTGILTEHTRQCTTKGYNTRREFIMQTFCPSRNSCLWP